MAGLIGSGESSGVEFKRDDVRPERVFTDLDRRRLINYFRGVRQQECPDVTDEEAWTRLLVTVGKMRAGYRATRNELVKEVLRDYRYVEATGLGVPRKIVRGMREHNGTEPDLIEEDGRFTVRLWKQSTAAAQ